MSSPSNSSHGKRKRTGTNSSNAVQGGAEMDQLVQAESRDASGEEGDTTAPESGREPTTHNHKRQKANSERTPGAALADGASTSADHAAAADPGEPSDTTEASIDIAERVARKGARKAGNGSSKDGRNQQVSMPPPPIGKLTHPVGYETNPPPVGRAVRIYADGVFDLFHLGYVSASSC
jgi:choline-phosphate cytidylyltransferase